MPRRAQRIVLFGDTVGIPQVLDAIGPERIAALAVAGIRPAQHDSIADMARRARCALLVQPRSTAPEYPEFLTRLRGLHPDLLLINSYSMILRPDVLAIPPMGAVNVHGALLPAYRGATVTEWAILNEETQTGVTMHLVDEGIDTGPIIAQRCVPLHFTDTWLDVRRRVQEATVQLLGEELPDVLDGNIHPVPQDASRARHHRRRSPEDGVFDWDLPVRSIYNLVRALVPPHPGARYKEPGGMVRIIDRYLSMPEIMAMKFSPDIGAHRLQGDTVRLLPQPPEGEARNNANMTITFRAVAVADGLELGTCRLDRIDYVAGDCRLEIRPDDAQRWHGEAFALMRQAAVQELGLLAPGAA